MLIVSAPPRKGRCSRVANILIVIGFGNRKEEEEEEKQAGASGSLIVFVCFSYMLLVSLRNEVIGSILLISCNEIGVINRREGVQFLQSRNQLTLQIMIEHTGTLHRTGQIGVVDIPTADHLTKARISKRKERENMQKRE